MGAGSKIGYALYLTLLFGGAGTLFYYKVHKPTEIKIKAHEQNKHWKTSSSSSKEHKLRCLEAKIQSGELSIKEAEEQIIDIYGSVLGREKTRRIMNIAKNPNYSSREVSEKIVDEVPTGLAKPLDRLVKEYAKQYVR